MLTKEQVTNALRTLGVKEGDTVITHSSFKSLGPCEDGAATVIDGYLDAVGKEGTVVFPTLCQKDWEHVYENWNLDAPSDVGYLTNYFRKLPGVLRSNQATHSVAALGRLAEYLTATHGESGLRYGTYGDTPFSKDSPWQKLYEMDAKTIFIGCSLRTCTFRHLAEYMVVDEYLSRAEGHPEYEALKAEVWCYEKYERGGVWPHTLTLYVTDILEKEGKLKRTTCGEAEVALLSARDFVDLTVKLLREHDEGIMSTHLPKWSAEANLDWMRRIENLT